MAAGLSYVGSVSTLISSILESGGYLYQSYFIEEFKDLFKGSVGGFVYLMGLVYAIFFFSVRGKFQLVSWLIIGPPIFFASVLPTTSIGNATWKFANQDRNQSHVDKEVKKVFIKPEAQYKTSTLFAKYNRLVSNTVQEIVATINDARNTKSSPLQRDKMFIYKAQMYSRLYTRRLTQPNFRAFIHDGLFFQCGNFITAAQLAKDPKASETTRLMANREFDAPGEAGGKFKQVNKTFQNEPSLKYLANIPAGDDPTGKLQGTTDLTKISAINFSCEEIWKLVTYGLVEYGKNVIANIENLSEVNDVQTENLLAEITEIALGEAAKGLDSQQQTNKLVNVIAKYTLRNEYYRGDSSAIISSQAQTAQEHPTIEVSSQSEMQESEHARISMQEQSEKTRMLHAASNLPYYQGLALMLLAATYPFFALMLLFPGKHTGFLHWFVLWLWIKSWDIGYAVVMLLDDIIFSLFALHRVPSLGNPELNTDFSLAMFALKQHDPTFQLATYYTIMAVALLSIPIISSQLILGSLSGGAGLVSAGAQSLGQLFAKAAQSSAQQNVATNLKRELYENRMERAFAYNAAKDGKGILTKSERDEFLRASTEKRSEILKKLNSYDPNSRLEDAVPQLVGDLPKDRFELSNPNYRSSVISTQRQSILNRRAAKIEAERNKLISGGAEGLAGPSYSIEGFVNNVFGANIPLTGNVKQFIKDTLKFPLPAAKLLDFSANTYIESRSKEIPMDEQWATHDALFSDRGFYLERLYRWHGGLEVAWSQNVQGENPYVAQSDYELATFENKMQAMSVILSTAGEMFSNNKKLGKPEKDQIKSIIRQRLAAYSLTAIAAANLGNWENLIDFSENPEQLLEELLGRVSGIPYVQDIDESLPEEEKQKIREENERKLKMLNEDAETIERKESLGVIVNQFRDLIKAQR